MENRRIDLLEEILKINSVNGNEEEVADCLASHLQKAGIETKKVQYDNGRANLVAEIGNGGSVFSLSGHMDVVSEGELKDWNTPPFSAVDKDGVIYGRGACDMKSGLSAMVMAMIELKEEKVEFDGRVRLLATVGEEVGLLGAKQLTEQGYASDVEAMIIGEPTGRRIVYAHKGVLTYTINSRGKSAHSSMPELGCNAIDNLIIFYNKMMAEFAKLTAENVALGKFVHNTSIINGGHQVNSVPDFATLTMNVRTTPEVNNSTVQSVLENIVSELNTTVKDMDLELTIKQSTSPVFSDVNSKLVKSAKIESQKMFKEDLPLFGAPGGTDAAEFILGNKDMQIIIFGPGNESLHQTNEHIEIASYLEMVDLYKNIILSYFSQSE